MAKQKLNKSTVNKLFKQMTAHMKDKGAVREAWGLFLDMLQRDGQITSRQYDTWLMPRGMA
jgi:hypothetical protein